jgi:hypothetical protein
MKQHLYDYAMANTYSSFLHGLPISFFVNLFENSDELKYILQIYLAVGEFI